MAYQNITSRNSGNFTPAASVPAVFGMARSVDHITVHWWGEPAHKPAFWGVVDYLCDSARPNRTSAHAVIEAGICAWIVNGWDAAWHAGSALGNARSIGLELNPRCSAGDWETAAEVIADIWLQYGRILPLRPHSDHQSTECPGQGSGRGYNVHVLYARALEIYKAKKAGKTVKAVTKVKEVAKKAVVKATPASKVGDSGIKWTVEDGDTLWSVGTYMVGRKLAAAYVEQIKKLNGLKGNTIKKGQVLKMPTGIYWITDPGDSLAKISPRWGVAPQWIRARNGELLKNVGDGTVLFPNQTIKIG